MDKHVIDLKKRSVEERLTIVQVILSGVLEDILEGNGEQKTANWIKMSDAEGTYWACSACGEELPRWGIPPDTITQKPAYCPCCMRRMED